MTNKKATNQPTKVSEKTKRVGDTDTRWAWVEGAVWTTRMLTALEKGIKGGKWFSVIDKVYARPNLEAAFARVKANRGAAGVDHQTVEMFQKQLEAELGNLSASLRAGTYRPAGLRRVWIPKPGNQEKRPLGIPTVRDRVVQTALRHVMEPIFERTFAEQSYGFRPGRGTKDALRRVAGLLHEGSRWIVDMDLKSYFDTIPHQKLMERVREQITDGRVLELVSMYLKQGVLSEMGEREPERGTPQGAVISPLLANIYLNPLDQLMAKKGWEMVRYADDCVILCRNQAHAEGALRQVQQWTQEAGLVLHPDKTQMVHVSEGGGFDFLGYHFERGRRWPRQESLKKLKDRIRAQTRRNSGQSLACIIQGVNRTLRGWFE